MVGNPARKMLVRKALDALGGALVFAACASALYYWDPSRALLKRMTAGDRNLYEVVDPRLREQDPAALIHVRDAGSLLQTRQKAIEAVWGEGGLPVGVFPDQVIRDVDKRPPAEVECPSGPYEELLRKLDCEAGNYRGWTNLAGIDDLRVSIGSPSVPSVYVASVAYFRPLRPNGTLVVYQNGYASTYHAQYRYLERLVAAGFTVAAANLANYGDNNCPKPEQQPWCAVSAGAFDVPLPLRVHFTPLVSAVNFAFREGSVREVAMVGFSGGAWIAAVMAALDPRIRTSYPVAGVMPAYLRRAKENPPHQDFSQLVKAAGMLDLFVLGATGPGRRQVQFFNRYDRCCYNGVRPLLYVDAVRKAVRDSGGGAFDVKIDESHARHKVSRWTFEHIVADLDRAEGAR